MKIQVLLKSDNNYRYYTCRRMYVVDDMLLNSC